MLLLEVLEDRNQFLPPRLPAFMQQTSVLVSRLLVIHDLLAFSHSVLGVLDGVLLAPEMGQYRRFNLVIP